MTLYIEVAIDSSIEPANRGPHSNDCPEPQSSRYQIFNSQKPQAVTVISVPTLCA
jgi:hypothetical protein